MHVHVSGTVGASCRHRCEGHGGDQDAEGGADLVPGHEEARGHPGMLGGDPGHRGDGHRDEHEAVQPGPEGSFSDGIDTPIIAVPFHSALSRSAPRGRSLLVRRLRRAAIA